MDSDTFDLVCSGIVADQMKTVVLMMMVKNERQANTYPLLIYLFLQHLDMTA
jgi:hypothetical protein